MSPAAADPSPQGGRIASKLNWLRAGVLGANDGIISTAALIFGVAGAAVPHQTVLLAGVAAVAAGALSMAVGEYVSVSTQRDLEQAELAHERGAVGDARWCSKAARYPPDRWRRVVGDGDYLRRGRAGGDAAIGGQAIGAVGAQSSISLSTQVSYSLPDFGASLTTT